MVKLEIEELCLLCKGRKKITNISLPIDHKVVREFVVCSSCGGVGKKKRIIKVCSYKEIVQ